MGKLAIDVVILPPEEIMDKAISINLKEAERGNARGPLAKDDFYPHISLAMGTIKEEDFEKIKEIFMKILEKQNPLSIELIELDCATKSDGSKSYAMRAQKTEEIQKIHEELMNNLLPYFSYDATLEDLYKKESEETKPPSHVNTFHEKFSFENFDPHLTLRCKKVEFNDFPVTFTASTLAICHVGTETTCRKILFETELRTMTH